MFVQCGFLAIEETTLLRETIGANSKGFATRKEAGSKKGLPNGEEAWSTKG